MLCLVGEATDEFVSALQASKKKAGCDLGLTAQATNRDAPLALQCILRDL